MQTTYRDKVSKIVGWGHWFTFVNVLIAVAIGVRYAIAGGWPTALLDNFYLFVYLLGHFAFLYFLGFIALLFPIAFVCPWWRAYRTVAIITATLAQSALLLDCQFYSELGIHSNPLLYELLFNAQSENIQMTWWKAGALFALLLILEVAVANWLSMWRESRSRRALGKRLSQFFFACFFAYNFANAAADVTGYKGIIRQQDFFPLSYPLTAKTTLSKWGITSIPEASDDVLNVRFHYPLEEATDISPQTGLNVVMVVVSSLRSDMLNDTNMPYTTALARQSLWANRYYTTAKNHSDSMFGLLYGIPATYRKAANYAQVPPLLTSWLKQNGYELGLFSSRALNQFEVQYKNFETSYTPIQRVNAALADTATLHQWQLHYAQHKDKPSFHLVNLMGVERFATPPGFSNPFQPDLEGVLLLDKDAQMDPTALLNRYKNAVLHVDQLINYIVSQIDFSNTVLLITGDHGWSYPGSTSKSTSKRFHPQEINVPFLMTGANITPKVINGLSSHYDISPTLFELLAEQEVDTRSFSSGVSMLRPREQGWLLLGRQNEFAVVEPDRLTTVEKFGDYKIFDTTMQRQRNARLRVIPMAGAVREMQRFARNGSN